MKFGIELGSSGMRDMVKLSQAAEQAGFNSLWIADHVPAYMWRDPFITMTAIGLNTEQIRLGCGVANPYSRHVAITGVAFASMAELLGERLVLGIGAGGTLPLRPLDIKMWNKPVAAVRESVQVFRQLFDGTPVDFRGEVIPFVNTRLFGKCSIPIHIGTRGPALSRLAGEIADGIILNPPLAALPAYLEKVREGLRESGRSKIEVIEFVPVGVSDRGKVEGLRATVAILVPTTPRWALEMVGEVESAAKVSEMIKSDRPRAAQLVPEHMVRSFAISGTARSCVEQIEAVQSDVDELVALYLPSTTEMFEMISTFQRDIIPSF